jgi:RNA polymerase sigma-70 factor (ECF subfamily)
MGEPLDGKGHASFASFYTEHAVFMRRVLARRGVPSADLDDVAQEAFVAAHRNLPAFEGRSSLRTWLTAIAWRTASSYHRRSQRHRSVDLDDTQPVIDLAVGPAFDTHDLPAACEALEPDLRDLLLLHHVGGLSVSELSNLTGRARATIRLRLELGQSLVERRRSARPNAVEPAPSYAQIEGVIDLSVAGPEPQLLPNKQVCFSAVDDVLIHVWGGPTSPEYLKSSGDSMEALLARYPNGIRYLNVLEASSKPPTREGRHVNGELARHFGHRMRAVSFAVQSSTLMRIAAPILNSYFALVRAPVNIRFFNAVGPATAWLAHDEAEQGRLLSCVAQMRGSLEKARRD